MDRGTMTPCGNAMQLVPRACMHKCRSAHVPPKPAPPLLATSATACHNHHHHPWPRRPSHHLTPQELCGPVASLRAVDQVRPFTGRRDTSGQSRQIAGTWSGTIVPSLMCSSSDAAAAETEAEATEAGTETEGTETEAAEGEGTARSAAGPSPPPSGNYTTGALEGVSALPQQVTTLRPVPTLSHVQAFADSSAHTSMLVCSGMTRGPASPASSIYTSTHSFTRLTSVNSRWRMISNITHTFTRSHMCACARSAGHTRDPPFC